MTDPTTLETPTVDDYAGAETLPAAIALNHQVITTRLRLARYRRVTNRCRYSACSNQS